MKNKDENLAYQIGGVIAAVSIIIGMVIIGFLLACLPAIGVWFGLSLFGINLHLGGTIVLWLSFLVIVAIIVNIRGGNNG